MFIGLLVPPLKYRSWHVLYMRYHVLMSDILKRYTWRESYTYKRKSIWIYGLRKYFRFLQTEWKINGRWFWLGLVRGLRTNQSGRDAKLNRTPNWNRSFESKLKISWLTKVNHKISAKSDRWNIWLATIQFSLNGIRFHWSVKTFVIKYFHRQQKVNSVRLPRKVANYRILQFINFISLVNLTLKKYPVTHTHRLSSVKVDNTCSSYWVNS